MNIYLAIPSRGQIDNETLMAIAFASRKHNVIPSPSACPLLSFGFNRHWCNAINQREKFHIDRFAMIHSDQGADPWWLDALEDERETCGADLLSVACPLKNDEGLTSTGVYDYSRPDSVRRLTMKELYNLPETFGIEDVRAMRRFEHDSDWRTDLNAIRDEVAKDTNDVLAVNTGMWICRLDRPWIEDPPYFDEQNGIAKVNGEWVPRVLSEDWFFSLQCAKRGIKVMATRKIGEDHYGRTKFTNREPWGTLKTDIANAPPNAH